MTPKATIGRYGRVVIWVIMGTGIATINIKCCYTGVEWFIGKMKPISGINGMAPNG